MSLTTMPLLALILYTPWFLILSTLYWLYPRQPRTMERRCYDVLTLLLALAACVLALHWSVGFADHRHGTIWPQILATSVGYGAFLAVLVPAWFLRRRLLLARA